MKKEYRKPQILVETIDGDCLLDNLSMGIGNGGGNAGGAHSKGNVIEADEAESCSYPIRHSVWDD